MLLVDARDLLSRNSKVMGFLTVRSITGSRCWRHCWGRNRGRGNYWGTRKLLEESEENKTITGKTRELGGHVPGVAGA